MKVYYDPSQVVRAARIMDSGFLDWIEDHVDEYELVEELFSDYAAEHSEDMTDYYEVHTL